MQPKFTQKSLGLCMRIFVVVFILLGSMGSYAQVKQNVVSVKKDRTIAPSVMSVGQSQSLNGKQVQFVQQGQTSNSATLSDNDAGKITHQPTFISPNSPQTTCTTFTFSVSGTDPTMSARPFRDGVTKTCASPGTCTAGLAGTFHYQIYQWVCCATQCVTITYNATNANFSFVTVYNAPPVLGATCTNWVTDAGLSATVGTPLVFSFNAIAGTTYYFLVNDVGALPASGTIQVDAATCFCTPCSGTPAPGNTLSTLAVAGPGTPFTLSVSNNPPVSGLVHYWQKSTTGVGGPWTTIGSGASNTFTTSQIVASCYRDSVVCTTSGLYGIATPVCVALDPCGWSYSTAIPIPIMDAPAVTVGGNIYTFTAVSNGFVVTNSYKFNGATWSAIASYPVAAEFPSAATDGNNVYIIGGYTSAPSTTVYRYNVATNTYTLMAPCSVGVWNQSSVYYNGKIYKMGGFTGAGGATPVNTLEIYDIAGNTWTTGANMPTALGFMSVVAVGQYIYAIGGTDAAGVGVQKTYRYDPATNTWNDAAIPDLPGTRWGASAYLYGPYNGYGSIAIAGGYTNNGTTISNTALIWDPSSGSPTWSTLPSMQTVSARFAAASLNGAYYALGGRQTNSFAGSTFNQKLFCNFPACAGTPAPGNTLGPNFVCQGGSFSLSLQNVPSISGLTFLWQSSTDGVTYGPASGVNNTGIYSGVFLGTAWYRCQVTCTNSGLTGTSTPLKISDGQGVFTAQPANATAQCSLGTSFTVTATGLALSFRWEYRANSSLPWLAVNDGGSGCNTATISGSQTNVLTLTNVPSSWSGYQFRAYMFGPCTAPDYTNSATLTVAPLVATVTPTSASICSGQIQKISLTNASVPTTASFTTGAISVGIPDNTATPTLSNITVSGIPAGSIISNITIHLNMTHTYPADMVFNLKGPEAGNTNIFDLYKHNTNTDNGAVSIPTAGFYDAQISSTGTVLQFKAVPSPYRYGQTPPTGPFAADALNGVTNPGYSIMDPAGYASNCTNISQLYSLTGNVNGVWSLVMCDGGPGDLGTLLGWTIDITYGAAAPGVWTSNPALPNTMFTDPGATTPYVAGSFVNAIYVNPTVNTTYCVTYATNCPTCTSAPTCVPVSVYNPIAGLGIKPANNPVCVGGTTTFTDTTTNTSPTPYAYQWQVSNNSGVTYTNLTDGANVTGSTAKTLTLKNVTTLMNNYLYRSTVTAGPCGSQTSAVGKLTVNPLPTITLTGSPTQIMPGTTATLTVTSSPAAATYSWTRDGSALTGVTGSSYTADADGIGTYAVTVTDVNGCTNTSANLVISAQVSNNLFIYPNPNNGIFQVRVYNPLIYFNDTHILTIYNSAGQIVLTKSFDSHYPYTKFDFDMSGHAKGVYIVHVQPAHQVPGVIYAGKVVIQ